MPIVSQGYICPSTVSLTRKLISRFGADPSLLTLQLFNAIRFAALIGISIVLAKIADPGTIYAFESLLLIGSAFSFFFISGLSNSLLPLYKSASGRDERAEIFPSALVILGLFTLISVGLMNIYNFTLNDPDLRHITLIYSAFMFFNLLSVITENLLLAIGRNTLLITWGILTFAAYIGFIVLPINLDLGLEAMVYLLLLLGISKFALTLVFIHLLNGWNTSVFTMKRILKYTAPVMLSLFIANAYVYFNSFWVKSRFSEMDFNLFRYGTKEFPLFIILANSFSTVQSGFMAQHRQGKGISEDSLTGHRQSLSRLMNQLFPAAIVLILLARPIFRNVFAPEFEPAAWIFVILLFGLQSRLLFPQSMILAIHQTHYTIKASLAELFTGVLLSVLLGSYIGLPGIALGMIIAALIDKLFLIHYLKKSGIHYWKYVPLKLYIGYTSLMLLALWIVS